MEDKNKNLTKAQLLKKVENYENFINGIEDFLCVLDMNGCLIQSNDSLFKRLGYSEKELIGKSILDFHPEERKDEVLAVIKKLQTTGTDTCPVPLITKSGKQIPVESRIISGEWDSKKAYFVITRDISKMGKNEEKFSKLFHLNPIPCALSTLDEGIYTEVNDAFVKMFEFSREEVLGKTALELGIITKENREDLFLMADEKGNFFENEVVLSSKDGISMDVLISSENIYIQSAENHFIVFNDITQRKKYIEAEKRNMDVMNHDLRGAVSRIIGFASLLLDEDDYGEDQVKLFHSKIYNSAKKMLELMESYVLLLRVERGMAKLNKESKTFFDLIKSAKDIFLYSQKFGSTISVRPGSYNEDLFYKKVNIDTLFLEAILANLFRNADEEALKHDKKVTVDIFNNSSGDKLCLKVSNQGEIPDEIRENLFKEFVTSKVGGTGLGLYSARKFAEAHGWELIYKPSKGNTAFIVKIPYEDELT